MEIPWADVWSLFRWSILAALLAGVVCPLVGCFLLVRRTGFYGIALPQFAATGIAFAFALLPWWIAHVGLADLDLETALESPHAVMNYHLAWAGVFTFGGLFLLYFFGGRRETETGRVAAGFAVASALTILLAQASPMGMEFVETLLRGEILTVGVHELETIAVVYALVVVLLARFHRDLLLVSYDRETALVLKKPARALEALLLFLTGLTVAAGVGVLGPLVLFGLLVIPPLAARGFARSMRSFYVAAGLLGAAAAALGVAASFHMDWPLGPSVVAAAALELAPGWLAGRHALGRGGAQRPLNRVPPPPT